MSETTIVECPSCGWMGKIPGGEDRTCIECGATMEPVDVLVKSSDVQNALGLPDEAIPDNFQDRLIRANLRGPCTKCFVCGNDYDDKEHKEKCVNRPIL